MMIILLLWLLLAVRDGTIAKFLDGISFRTELVMTAVETDKVHSRYKSSLDVWICCEFCF